MLSMLQFCPHMDAHLLGGKRLQILLISSNLKGDLGVLQSGGSGVWKLVIGWFS